ncbi:DUF1254 domain-containing protein [Consotaella salsifontis]|uniref:Uncharacterized membrane protein n=1 Tax=Consotaella salsifontis TaxID=1365950 RepID=A0A1T4MFR7_9HYPH|nr:DUF1254 domain-containing protein [Consotaella salsifontis]SJZ65696.1 Uncharacterized membrane protein [Consotaella salsifontis]
MAKLLYAILVGLVGAAIVHIAVILTIPHVAERDAWGRLSGLGDLWKVIQIDGATGTVAGVREGPEHFAFLDPAFAIASCRFALGDGPAHLYSPEKTDFWSASVYDRQGNNRYSISDRSAVGGAFDLIVGTPDQLLESRVNSADQDETQIPVEADFSEGYVILRALIEHESERASVNAFSRSMHCEPLNG